MSPPKSKPPIARLQALLATDVPTDVGLCSDQQLRFRVRLLKQVADWLGGGSAGGELLITTFVGRHLPPGDSDHQQHAVNSTAVVTNVGAALRACKPLDHSRRRRTNPAKF